MKAFPGTLWSNLAITQKFTYVFAILLTLLLLIACTGYLATHSIRVAENTIRTNRDIAHTVLEMDRGMERAYRLHGDFFLHYRFIGLQKAHELYAQPSIREIAKVISLSNDLHQQIFMLHEITISEQNQRDINLYLASAKRFADTSIASFELLTERAAPERGVEAQLAVLCQRLEASLIDRAAEVRTLRDMKSSYKDYMISRQRSHMQLAQNSSAELQNALLHDPTLLPSRKTDLLRLLDQHTQLVDRLLAIDHGIASKMRDFHLQRQALAPISPNLIALTQEKVAQSERRIDRVHFFSGIIILLSTMLSLLALIYVIRVVHHSIIRNVVNLARTATSFSEGNLAVRVPEAGTDELGLLATSFNTMAARLQTLIENLETEVKKRTEALVRSEDRFRQLFDHSSSGVVVYEPLADGLDFIIRDVNRAAEEIEHLAREYMLGRPVTEVFPGIGKMGLLDIFRQVLKTGEPMHPPAALYQDDHQSSWRQNRVYRLPSGEIVAVYDDISGQKQAEDEKRELEQSLQRAQKMEAIGLMAGGIAHDLNNTLSAIVGYPELLLVQLPPDSPLRKPLTTIKEAGERAAAVVADLLTIAKGVASTRQVAVLDPLVRECLKAPEYNELLRHHPQTRLKHFPAAEQLAVSCSPIHIKKCILTLIANGIESMQGAGTITLSTLPITADHKAITTYGLQPVAHAVLTFTDTGPAIAPGDLAHIFEPFYTKRAMGKTGGTGLGLSVVWNTMRDHGGTATVSSSEKGTTFSLFFPLAEQQEKVVEEMQSADDLRGRGESILVVDDEPHQGELVQEILGHYGYRVTCANSGEDAILYMQGHQADLIILDMIMAPGINGRETFTEIIKQRPGQRAIIASGFSESEDVRATLEMGAGGFIKKPYAMQELAALVKNVLTD